ncbi:hypothetical protein IJG78_03810, partial [Candidatus Saccharibacteria bacterium]|nr:hypothetical protein [Candidatus Saccharibacteria bacterium]
SSPQLIQSTSSANTTGVTKDLYFGVRANFSLPSGSYSNTIVYTAAGNAGTSSGFVVSPTQSSTVKGGGDTLTITTTLYTNYTLSPSDVTVTIGGNTCTVSSVYTNTSTGTVEIKCTTPSSSSIGLKNVVVNIDKFSWSSTLTNGFNYGDFWTITYMQEMTSQICNTVYTPSNVTGSSALLKTSRADYTATTSGTAQVAQRTLYDYRGIDGTGTASSPATGSNAVSYTVRKLADGNCWMSENLKLTLSTSHAYEVGTFSGGTASWTPNEDTSSSNPYNIAISQNTKANVNGGKWYYPWYAATAGQGTNTANPTINRSICPKGWRLPAISNNPSFHDLIITAYSIGNSSAGSTKLQSAPLSFYYTGYYISGGPQGLGTGGFYWSANSSSDSSTAIGMSFNATAVTVSADYLPPKYDGFAVRCVAIP